MGKTERTYGKLSRQGLLGFAAAASVMLGLVGVGVVTENVAAQTPGTRTATATATVGGVTPPNTGTSPGERGSDNSGAVAGLSILGIALLGGGAAAAMAGRRRG